MAGKKPKKPRPDAGQPDAPRAGYEQWQWWGFRPDRKSGAQKEFLSLPPQARGELVDRMKRFREGTTRFKDVAEMGDGIKEIRVRITNNHYRVLFFVDGHTPVALTCFAKNQNKTPKTDLDRAKSRKKSHGS